MQQEVPRGLIELRILICKCLFIQICIQIDKHVIFIIHKLVLLFISSVVLINAAAITRVVALLESKKNWDKDRKKKKIIGTIHFKLRILFALCN